MTTASIGTVSHGTLNEDDLIEAFWNELEWQLGRQERVPGTDECKELDKLRENVLGRIQDSCWDENGDLIEDMDVIDEAIIDLCDALDTFAPAYCYFGAHMGDGSDFGYWPDFDAIDELPNVQDSDEARELGEDCKFVNDHGNVTVYAGNGSIVLELV